VSVGHNAKTVAEAGLQPWLHGGRGGMEGSRGFMAWGGDGGLGLLGSWGSGSWGGDCVFGPMERGHRGPLGQRRGRQLGRGRIER
jgi:hypothetical protein